MTDKEFCGFVKGVLATAVLLYAVLPKENKGGLIDELLKDLWGIMN